MMSAESYSIAFVRSMDLDIDVDSVYGGVSYLNKQDFIIMNQQKRIEEKQAGQQKWLGRFMLK